MSGPHTLSFGSGEEPPLLLSEVALHHARARRSKRIGLRPIGGGAGAPVPSSSSAAIDTAASPAPRPTSQKGGDNGEKEAGRRASTAALAAFFPTPLTGPSAGVTSPRDSTARRAAADSSEPHTALATAASPSRTGSEESGMNAASALRASHALGRLSSPYTLPAPRTQPLPPPASATSSRTDTRVAGGEKRGKGGERGRGNALAFTAARPATATTAHTAAAGKGAGGEVRAGLYPASLTAAPQVISLGGLQHADNKEATARASATPSTDGPSLSHGQSSSQQPPQRPVQAAEDGRAAPVSRRPITAGYRSALRTTPYTTAGSANVLVQQLRRQQQQRRGKPAIGSTTIPPTTRAATGTGMPTEARPSVDRMASSSAYTPMQPRSMIHDNSSSGAGEAAHGGGPSVEPTVGHVSATPSPLTCVAAASPSAVVMEESVACSMMLETPSDSMVLRNQRSGNSVSPPPPPPPAGSGGAPHEEGEETEEIPFSTDSPNAASLPVEGDVSCQIWAQLPRPMQQPTKGPVRAATAPLVHSPLHHHETEDTNATAIAVVGVGVTESAHRVTKPTMDDGRSEKGQPAATAAVGVTAEKEEEDQDGPATECSVDAVGLTPLLIGYTPRGRHVLFNLLSTWGDPHEIGLCGVELYDERGRRLVPVRARRSGSTVTAAAAAADGGGGNDSLSQHSPNPASADGGGKSNPHRSSSTPSLQTVAIELPAQVVSVAHDVVSTSCGVHSSVGVVRLFAQYTATPAELLATGNDAALQDIENDPRRQLTSLLNGIANTHDEANMFVMPYTPGQHHLLCFMFTQPVTLSMIRIINYSGKGRVHALKGARVVEVTMDDTVIFRGEVAQHSGDLIEDTALLGLVNCENILFTEEPRVLRRIMTGSSRPAREEEEEGEKGGSEGESTTRSPASRDPFSSQRSSVVSAAEGSTSEGSTSAAAGTVGDVIGGKKKPKRASTCKSEGAVEDATAVSAMAALSRSAGPDASPSVRGPTQPVNDAGNRSGGGGGTRWILRSSKDSDEYYLGGGGSRDGQSGGSGEGQEERRRSRSHCSASPTSGDTGVTAADSGTPPSLSLAGAHDDAAAVAYRDPCLPPPAVNLSARYTSTTAGGSARSSHSASKTTTTTNTRRTRRSGPTSWPTQYPARCPRGITSLCFLFLTTWGDTQSIGLSGLRFRDGHGDVLPGDTAICDWAVRYPSGAHRDPQLMQQLATEVPCLWDGCATTACTLPFEPAMQLVLIFSRPVDTLGFLEVANYSIGDRTYCGVKEARVFLSSSSSSSFTPRSSEAVGGPPGEGPSPPLQTAGTPLASTMGTVYEQLWTVATSPQSRQALQQAGVFEVTPSEGVSLRKAPARLAQPRFQTYDLSLQTSAIVPTTASLTTSAMNGTIAANASSTPLAGGEGGGGTGADRLSTTSGAPGLSHSNLLSLTNTSDMENSWRVLAAGGIAIGPGTGGGGGPLGGAMDARDGAACGVRGGGFSGAAYGLNSGTFAGGPVSTGLVVSAASFASSSLCASMNIRAANAMRRARMMLLERPDWLLDYQPYITPLLPVGYVCKVRLHICARSFVHAPPTAASHTHRHADGEYAATRGAPHDAGSHTSQRTPSTAAPATSEEVPTHQNSESAASLSSSSVGGGSRPSSSTDARPVVVLSAGDNLKAYLREWVAKPLRACSFVNEEGDLLRPVRPGKETRPSATSRAAAATTGDGDDEDEQAQAAAARAEACRLPMVAESVITPLPTTLLRRSGGTQLGSPSDPDALEPSDSLQRVLLQVQLDLVYVADRPFGLSVLCFNRPLVLDGSTAWVKRAQVCIDDAVVFDSGEAVLGLAKQKAVESNCQRSSPSSSSVVGANDGDGGTATAPLPQLPPCTTSIKPFVLFTLDDHILQQVREEVQGTQAGSRSR